MAESCCAVRTKAIYGTPPPIQLRHDSIDGNGVAMAETAPFSAERLTPPLYHQQLVALLKAREPELWQWASSARAEEDHTQQVRAHLLKHTYRLDEQGHGDVVRSAAAVAERLGIV